MTSTSNVGKPIPPPTVVPVPAVEQSSAQQQRRREVDARFSAIDTGTTPSALAAVTPPLAVRQDNQGIRRRST
jgi:hypothetical protein